MEAYPLLRKYMDFSLREMKNSMLQAWTSRVLAAADEGKPIVYSQFTIFCELFTALDIPTIPPEVWNGMMMSMEPAAGAKAIDAAEQAGIHPELCATFKILIGNLLQGEIPRPAAVINTSYPCDSGRATYEILEYLCDVPHHVIECPYFANNDEALSYWVDRYKGTIRFLEETFHRRLDYDRLREVVEESNKTIEVILDINEVFKRKPLPVLGPTNAGYLAFQTLLGTPVATDFLKGYLADLNRAVASNSKAIEVERVRLLYGYAPFYWNPKFNRWLAEEKKTVVPASIFNFLSVGPVDTSTNESMIMGLAERAVRMPMAKHGAVLLSSTSMNAWTTMISFSVIASSSTCTPAASGYIRAVLC